MTEKVQSVYTGHTVTFYFNSHRDATSTLVKLKWEEGDPQYTVEAVKEIQSLTEVTLSAGDEWNGHIIPANTDIEIRFASKKGFRTSEWTRPWTFMLDDVSALTISRLLIGTIAATEDPDADSDSTWEEFEDIPSYG